MEKVEKNKKLNTVLLVILGVIIVAIIVALIMLHNVNQKNEAAFNADLNSFCVEHKIKISRSKNEFTVQISPDAWKIMTTAEKQLFCEVVGAEITTSLWDHHIMEKPWLPFIWFYVDGNMVAADTTGNVVLK